MRMNVGALRATPAYVLITFTLSFAATGLSKKLAPLPEELQGSMVPNFFALGIDNETELTRNSLKAEAQKSGARRIVLSFFATWCVNCREEFVLLQRNAAKLEDNGVQVYLINVGEKIIREGKKVGDFVKGNAGSAFPFYFDQNANLLKNFGIIEKNASQISLPVIVVMDSNLRVLSVFTEAGRDFPKVLWSDL